MLIRLFGVFCLNIIDVGLCSSLMCFSLQGLGVQWLQLVLEVVSVLLWQSELLLLMGKLCSSEVVLEMVKVLLEIWMLLLQFSVFEMECVCWVVIWFVVMIEIDCGVFVMGVLVLVVVVLCLVMKLWIGLVVCFFWLVVMVIWGSVVLVVVCVQVGVVVGRFSKVRCSVCIIRWGWVMGEGRRVWVCGEVWQVFFVVMVRSVVVKRDCQWCWYELKGLFFG